MFSGEAWNSFARPGLCNIPCLTSSLIIGRYMSPEPNESPDADLIRRTMQGDASAYGDLYDRYIDQIYRYVFARVADRAEAEDMTEEVFLKSWEALIGSRPTITNFQAWLYRIARNLIIDHYRTKKATHSLDQIPVLDDPGPLPERRVLDNLDNDRLVRAIQLLDENLQQVIICRFINGLTHAETAQVLETNENNTRIMQYRALKKLRKFLELDF
jgi:RNA polymerase sigma-70 factor (ECF subfamily)